MTKEIKKKRKLKITLRTYQNSANGQLTLCIPKKLVKREWKEMPRTVAVTLEFLD